MPDFTPTPVQRQHDPVTGAVTYYHLETLGVTNDSYNDFNFIVPADFQEAALVGVTAYVYSAATFHEPNEFENARMILARRGLEISITVPLRNNSRWVKHGTSSASPGVADESVFQWDYPLHDFLRPRDSIILKLPPADDHASAVNAKVAIYWYFKVSRY